MNDDLMKELRRVEIYILDYIVKICEENNLKYYILYGTLLGAIRHKGFIPWDDDIDIALPRNDYEKLCAILCKINNDKESEFFFQNIYTDISFKLPFSKLRKKGTLFLEEDNDNYKNSFENQGVFVDIFPLDTVKHKVGLQKIFSYLIYRLLGSENIQNGWKTRTAKFLATYYKSGNYYVNYGSPYKVEKDISEIKWFGKGTEVIFEEKVYNAPNDYSSFLTQLYGDYMKLPPKEKRINHNPKIIKL